MRTIYPQAPSLKASGAAVHRFDAGESSVGAKLRTDPDGCRLRKAAPAAEETANRTGFGRFLREGERFFQPVRCNQCCDCGRKQTLWIDARRNPIEKLVRRPMSGNPTQRAFTKLEHSSRNSGRAAILRNVRLRQDQPRAS